MTCMQRFCVFSLFFFPLSSASCLSYSFLSLSLFSLSIFVLLFLVHHFLFVEHWPCLFTYTPLQHIPPHYSLHFFSKETYQIIHFLYHIIYYSNKKITIKQIFSLSNTTFLFSHTNNLFIYLFLIHEQCIVILCGGMCCHLSNTLIVYTFQVTTHQNTTYTCDKKIICS